MLLLAQMEVVKVLAVVVVEEPVVVAVQDHVTVVREPVKETVLVNA